MELLQMVAFPSWLLWIVVLGVAAYWYLTRNHGYWKKHGIPYVPAVPIFGTLGSNLKRQVHELEIERYKKYGKIYGSLEGNRPVLTVADPELVKEILVKDFFAFTSRRDFKFGDPIIDNMVQVLQGENWKRVRTIITPAFATGKIRRMTSVIVDSAKTMTENFLKDSKDGTPVNARRLFEAFTMDVIASTAFATKIDSHNDPNNPFVATARSSISKTISWRLFAAVLFPSFMKIFKISLLSPGVSEFFLTTTLRIIEERKRTGQTKNDFLQLMMDAAKENLEDQKDDNEDDNTTDYSHGENNAQVFKPTFRYKNLSHNELIAQCILFFLAGYDTTASTMSFAAYNLALNPEVQEKVIKEIDETIREKGELTYEAIREMKYLDNVISETLRKFSFALRLERVADEEYELKDMNFTIPKGMIVGVPVYAMHHDEEYYPEPEKFDPDRFTPEGKSTRHPFTYLPFGAGPRNCIAMRFALMEVKIALVCVLRHLRFQTCPETKGGMIISITKEWVYFSADTLVNALLGYECINERFLTAKFQTSIKDLNVICCYASNENEKDRFYEQFQDILNSVKKGDITLVLGDFNAKVGTDSDLWGGVIGPFGIGSCNGNGQRLLQIPLEYSVGQGILSPKEVTLKIEPRNA